ncbi:MAG: DUF362 domain-containing protein [Clostridia bacterium]|nr:DUF362 domain-containing protein [Clostridia bacterium]
MVENAEYEVGIVKCEDYSEEKVKKAFDELLPLIGGLDWVTKGMKIAIKANLVTFMKPEEAATTHPSLLIELIKRLIEKGAEVVVGDSPGGPYNSLYLNRVYAATGMNELKKYGAKLNQNFEQETAKFPEAVAAKEFPYTAYLKEADAVINFCKLKSHGMMGMSAATKNLFGIIPGTIKPEFHYRFPKYEDFANMLIDLNEYIKPRLCIVDAVVGMEGNGPTAGVPKQIGAVLASTNPYKLDYVCAKIIGMEKENVPTLEESFKRGMIPEKVEEIKCNANVDEFIIQDFDTRKVHKRLSFDDSSKLFGRLAKKFLRSVPKLKADECIGCGKCAEVCPAKAITIENKKAKIDKSKCITCFCCQEFCPKGAMKVKRPIVAKILTK